MIYTNSITNSLFTTIASDSVLVNSSVSVDLHEIYNTDPRRTPWVGVYYETTDFEPKRLNIQQPWRADILLSVYVQVANFASGQEAHDQLDRVLTPVMTAINSNRNLDSTVDRIYEMHIEPYERSIDDEDRFFANEITIRCEVDA
ncbi:MAG: hypothetical protein CMB80_00425 [Flammeovirgaceae bacterium]|jgi:hypothetical protein|nr:hypothetical protein [Flammeovirgaceae bacterium]|tara:strand:- start:905 stop:1339 length:435 start_codon:yes stop_codon:yes gene_type:complete